MLAALYSIGVYYLLFSFLLLTVLHVHLELCLPSCYSFEFFKIQVLSKKSNEIFFEIKLEE
jgi:hypothetical protein